MAIYRRLTTTKEDRESQVIEKHNSRKNGNGTVNNKVCEFLSLPNVKEYNRILISKSFDNIRLAGGARRTFKSSEECETECEDYFRLCDKYDMMPTISSLCLYLGVDKDTLYEISNKPQTYEYSAIVRNAINTCHYCTQMGAISNTVNSVLYIYLSKNYYGMKDTQDINLSANQDTTINSQTMDLIKEQIASEQNQKLLK